MQEQLCFQLAIKEPVTETIIDVLDGPVVIQIKYLVCIGAHPEIETTHAQGTALCGDGSMCRAHVACHPPPPGKIVPLGYFPDHPVFMLLPGETIRTGWSFLAYGGLIEVGFDLLTDEMQR